MLVIGATNRIDIVDTALLRPGRFDRIIEVPLPDSKGRENIFRIHTKKKPLAEDVSLAKLVEMTEGFSGAEIGGICNRAAIAAIKRYVNNKEKSVKSIKITQDDLSSAIKKIRPERSSPSMLAMTS